MGVEFSWITAEKDATKVILDDESFFIIRPALEELEKKTGVKIDPYSDTRISPDHASLLIKIIMSYYTNDNPKVNEFTNMLKTSSDNHWWILAVGD